MTDTTAETATDATTADGAAETTEGDQGNPDALGDAGKKALDAMKADRNEARKTAAALQKEIEDLRKAQMSDTEKAIAEAESRGRTAAATELGKELAQTRFDALAGRRNADFDTTKALEYLDLSKFLGDDGRPDEKAIAAAVERLVPEPADGIPSFDGGTRTATKGTDFNQELRRAAGRA